MQVYWSTKKKDDGDTKDAAALPAAALKRQGSGITAVSLLKGDKKNMDPSELIKVRYICSTHYRLHCAHAPCSVHGIGQHGLAMMHAAAAAACPNEQEPKCM